MKKLKQRLRESRRHSFFWLGLGVVIAVSSFFFSVRSYLISLNKGEEVLIAQFGSGITYSQSGQVRVYYDGLGVYPRSVDLHINGPVIADLNDYRPQIVDWNKVSAGSTIDARIVGNDGAAYGGWMESNDDDTCGKTTKKDISGIVKSVESYGEVIESVQCWSGIGRSGYNDALLILSYTPGTTTETTTGTGTTTETVTTNTETTEPEGDTSFVIRKYLDANKDGVREVGEGMTNREWVYEYQINGGGKQIYTIEPGQEMGEEVAIKKGDRVRVEELGQEGWLNTTGAVVDRTLSQARLHYLNFGGYPVNGLPSTTTGANQGVFPATQPKTGTPLGLTLGVMGAGVVLLVLKKKFL